MKKLISELSVPSGLKKQTQTNKCQVDDCAVVFERKTIQYLQWRAWKLRKASLKKILD